MLKLILLGCIFLVANLLTGQSCIPDNYECSNGSQECFTTSVCMVSPYTLRVSAMFSANCKVEVCDNFDNYTILSQSKSYVEWTYDRCSLVKLGCRTTPDEPFCQIDGCIVIVGRDGGCINLPTLGDDVSRCNDF